MSSLTLMIVDSNDDFRLALKQALHDSYQIHQSGDGKDALNSAKKIRPDIIIMDLMLTGMDGITLLQELQSEGIRPMVMVVTRLNNAYVTDWVDELGIEYVMLKPCDPSAVAKRVHDLSTRLRPKRIGVADPAVYAAEQLNRLAFSPRHLGFVYLKDAIALMYQNPGISITKELYPAIGTKNDTSAVLVERSIRSAINAAWQQGNSQVWAEFFPLCNDGSCVRPSNGFFIARLSDDLHAKAGEP